MILKGSCEWSSSQRQLGLATLTYVDQFNGHGTSANRDTIKDLYHPEQGAYKFFHVFSPLFEQISIPTTP